jgi:repressor LexA
MTLSDRQVRILEFIRQYVEEHNYPPTIREIGKAVTIPSTSVVKYNLERLQEKGYIERSGEVSRGLRLTHGASVLPRGRATPLGLLEVPKLGMISAGAPIAAVGQQENPFAGDTLTLTSDLVSPQSELYALQVKGDSMIDALVFDGDWVIIRHQQTAERGDMIVAWIKDREETTLKYYHPEGATIHLKPANSAYQLIQVPAAQLQIQGKVVAVLRRLA